jgi:hypothetical protein
MLDLHGLSAATAQLALVDVLRRTFAFVCTGKPRELGDLKVGSSTLRLSWWRVVSNAAEVAVASCGAVCYRMLSTRAA